MDATREWATTIAEGHSAEARVAALLFGAAWRVKPANRDGAQDLEVTDLGGTTWRLEIKDESNYVGSGRLCIETQQGWPARPSGISISESTVCIHVLGEHAVLYRTQPMRLWIKASEYQPRLFARSTNNNCGVLVPIASVEGERWCEQLALARLSASRVWRWSALSC